MTGQRNHDGAQFSAAIAVPAPAGRDPVPGMHYRQANTDYFEKKRINVKMKRVPVFYTTRRAHVGLNARQRIRQGQIAAS